MSKLSKNEMDELDKIIIQSDELKKKVRIRVPKSDVPQKEGRILRDTPRDSSKQPKKKTSKGFYKLGSLKEKKGPSDFRKKSAKWRDVEEVKLNDSKPRDIGREIEERSFDDYYSEESFFEKIKSYTPIQWTAVAMAVVVFAMAVLTTGTYADYKGEQHKAVAFSQLPTYNDMADVELASVREEVVEEVEPIEMEEALQESGSVLSLVLTSVEKDLKIKLIDEEETLVKGVDWGVIIADSKGEESSFDDEEQDGIIHITDINAGDYSVSIKPSDSLAAYTIPSTASQVSVKAKVEYKVIANIKDEIKSEKEVNAAAEDANGNQAADVETGTALTDTVQFVESTKTESGETYVESSVDLSKCEVAALTVTDYIIRALKSLSGGTKTYSGINAAAVRFVADCENETDHVWDSGTFDSSNNDGTHKIIYKCTNADCTATKTENVNCDTNADGACSVCGYKKAEEPKACDHSAGKYEYVSNGNGTHKKTCSDCKTVVSESEACSYGSDNKCTACHADKPAESPASKTVTGVTLNVTAMSLVVGKTGNLSATIAPADATNKNISWKSSNDSVASVSNGTVTAKAAGTATITVVTEDQGKTATCEVTVTANDKKYKTTSQLYDSQGNKLYKLDGDKYSLATYADYVADNARKFFRQEKGYLYTGWQTINNQTYFYKADHTYVTGDQIIGGVTYHFATDGTLTKGSGTLGIDVSKYQPSINWSSVAASGISYVIIRCGYRGASTGALIQDPYFTSHIKGAKAAGLKVGVYFFSTALNEAEAVEEASMCAALCSGYGVNYPVFIDVESSSRPGYNSLPAAQRTANIKAFCSTIRSAGYTAGVYANKTWLTSYINTSELSGYKIWLAQYNASGPTYSGRYDLWQYTSKGSVNGISGNVDMNQSYLGY